MVPPQDRAQLQRRCLASSSILLTPPSTRSVLNGKPQILLDAPMLAFHMQITSKTVPGIGTSLLEREEPGRKQEDKHPATAQTALQLSSYGLTRCGPVVEQASLHSACGAWPIARHCVGLNCEHA
jgi:hypothetical protein